VNLASEREAELRAGRDRLARWLAEESVGAARGEDPHARVMAEGGPFHVRGQLPSYLRRLRETGRGELADLLEQRTRPVGTTV
jgi:hypothetical protein